MARSGIYKSEVVRARNNLLAMGRYPSIDAIRNELGNTGSKSTIQRFIKEIEEEEGGRSIGPQVAVSEAIQDLSTRLAERLHQEAEQHTMVLKDKHKAEIAALNDAMVVLHSEVESFRSQAERQAVELAAEKAALAETLNKLREEKIVQVQMTQRIQDMEGQLVKEEEHRLSLEEKHQHAKEVLEHFRSAAKEQREQNQRQFELQIQFLQGELRTTKEALNEKQHELIRSHEDNARLYNELAHSRSEIHRLETEVRHLHTIREQLAVSELKNQQMKEHLAQTMTHADELVMENKSYAQKLQDATQARDRLKAKLVTTKAVLTRHEQVLQKLTASQLLMDKGSTQLKGSAKTQKSLFNSDK